MNKQEPAADKPRWEKPEIKVVTLAAEEVMAVGCKHLNGHRAYRGRPACGIGVCYQLGS